MDHLRYFLTIGFRFEENYACRGTSQLSGKGYRTKTCARKADEIGGI